MTSFCFFGVGGRGDSPFEEEEEVLSRFESFLRAFFGGMFAASRDQCLTTGVHEISSIGLLRRAFDWQCVGAHEFSGG